MVARNRPIIGRHSTISGSSSLWRRSHRSTGAVTFNWQRRRAYLPQRRICFFDQLISPKTSVALDTTFEKGKVVIAMPPPTPVNCDATGTRLTPLKARQHWAGSAASNSISPTSVSQSGYEAQQSQYKALTRRNQRALQDPDSSWREIRYGSRNSAAISSRARCRSTDDPRYRGTHDLQATQSTACSIPWH